MEKVKRSEKALTALLPSIQPASAQRRAQVLSEGIWVVNVTPGRLRHSPRGRRRGHVTHQNVDQRAGRAAGSQARCRGQRLGGKAGSRASGADTGRGCRDADQSGPDHAAHPGLRTQAMIDRLPRRTARPNGRGHTVHTKGLICTEQSSAGSQRGHRHVPVESGQGQDDITGHTEVTAPHPRVIIKHIWPKPDSIVMTTLSSVSNSLWLQT